MRTMKSLRLPAAFALQAVITVIMPIHSTPNTLEKSLLEFFGFAGKTTSQTASLERLPVGMNIGVVAGDRAL